MEALSNPVVQSIVLLLVVQCLIGAWCWKLASDGRRIRRETTRLKAKSSVLREKNEKDLRDLETKFAYLQDVLDRFIKGGPAPEASPRQPAEGTLSTPDAVDAGSVHPAAPRPKLGIALSGGGGKGAYQVGVLRVLRAAGVRPDVIAGTSVGALNATLLCLDDVEVAVDFWNSVSFWQIARVGIANLMAIPLLIFGLITAGMSDGIDARMRRTILVRYYTFLLPANVVAVMMGLSWVGVLADVAGCAAVVTLGYLADPLIGLLGLALLSNAPLRAKIAANVPTDRIRAARTPLYVTVAARRRIVDPCRPHWLNRRERILVARQPYVPEYRCLQDESDEDVQRLVLQSAAIPFGVFPLRRIGRSDYVDGGVADNVPIQPLIDAGCTCIIVVHLNPDADCDGWRLTNEDDLWAREGELRELRRLSALGRDHTLGELADRAIMLEASPDLLGKEDSAHLRVDYRRAKVSFVHVKPSEPLGTFLTGTMNFSSRKARALIELGEQDAEAVLRASPDLAAWQA